VRRRVMMPNGAQAMRKRMVVVNQSSWRWKTGAMHKSNRTIHLQDGGRREEEEEENE